MDVGAGFGLIASGSLLGLVTAFGLWRRIAARAAFGLLVASGALVGAGALLVQDEAGPGEWALTLVVLGVLSPVHWRLLFGRPGPAR